MKVLAAYAIKGGVGKTAAAVSLACLAAGDGMRVLLWDLDPQSAATFMFRVRPKVKGGGRALVAGRLPARDAIKATDFPGLDLLPADFTYRNLDLHLDGQAKPATRLRAVLRPLRPEYDLVVLDCPPGISLLSENVLRAADLLLVPVIPATLSVRTLDQLAGFIAGLGGRHPQLLSFWSMVDRRKLLHRQITAGPPEGHGDGMASTAIPALSAIERMFAERRPVTAAAPRGQAARCYQGLWREAQARLGLRPAEAGASGLSPGPAGRRSSPR